MGKTFTIKEGGQREETLRLREAQLGDMLERISLPEFEVKDSAGNTVTCAELTKGGKKFLCGWKRAGSLRNIF